MTKPDPRDVRRLDPPEQRRITARKRGGLFVVEEWHWLQPLFSGHQPKPALSVISVGAAEKYQRCDVPLDRSRRIYHGLPGLTWEAAQELKRELRRTHERQ